MTHDAAEAGSRSAAASPAGEGAAAARPRAWLEPVLVSAFVVAQAAAFCAVTGIFAPGGVYHDNYRLAYPLRVLASTAFRSGTLPYWDHWTNAGAPLTTIYTAVVFSPVTLLLSAAGAYTPGRMALEIVLVELAGLAGAYLWLRRYAGRWPSLMAAAAFVLSAPMVTQAPVNFEGFAGPAMYGWLLFGAREALAGRRRGIAVIALAGWQMFTAGYLGTNVIAVQFLVVLALAEHALAPPRQARPLAATARGLLRCGAGVALWAGILTFVWLEMWSLYRFDLTQLRRPGFDPFTAAARLDSLPSLLFPNGVSPFVPDAFGAHHAPLYFGTFGVPFAIAALGDRAVRRVALPLAGLAALVYAAMLSREWWTGRFFTEHLPLFDQVRFHGWHASLVVLLLCGAAAAGAERFLVPGEGRRKLAAAAAFAALAAALRAWQHASGEPPAPLLALPQAGFLVALAAVAGLLAAPRSRLSGQAAVRIVAFLGVAELAAVGAQRVPLDLNRPTPEIVRAAEASKTPGFPPPSNERLLYAPHWNSHYATKVPAVVGYQPNAHPAFWRIRTAWDFGLLKSLLQRIFYPAAADGTPLAVDAAVRLTDFSTSRVAAEVELAEDAPAFVWSSPHTPNWALRVDGEPRATSPTAYGLTSFRLERGRHAIELRYRPPYLVWGLGLSIASALLAVGLLVAETAASRRRAPAPP